MGGMVGLFNFRTKLEVRGEVEGTKKCLKDGE